MAEVTIEDKLYSSISSYCSLNGIADINNFITNVLHDGFMVVKNGSSPMDKISIEKGYTENTINSSSFAPFATKITASDSTTANNHRKVKITVKKKTKDD